MNSTNFDGVPLISFVDKIKKTSIDPSYFTRDTLGLRENRFLSSESFIPLGFNGIHNYVFYDYNNLNREQSKYMNEYNEKILYEF